MNIQRREFSTCTRGRFVVRGFTLIELMITVAIVGILAAVALPFYGDYIRRGQIQEAFGALADYRTKMEQYYQDNRNYGSATNACASDPTASTWNSFTDTQYEYFSFICTTNTRPTPPDMQQQSYTLVATGTKGRAIGHTFTINERGQRTTMEFKNVKLTPAATCWLSKNSNC